jgi:flagellar hook assembly protein FlgD
VVVSTGILVGDKVVVAINGGTGDLATPYVITYLNAAADSDAPEFDVEPTAVGLTVSYTADEQHIVSYKVYVTNTGALVKSVSGAEKNGGVSVSFTWDGTDDDSAPVGNGSYTIVLTIKDYTGNAQDPFAVTVTKS